MGNLRQILCLSVAFMTLTACGGGGSSGDGDANTGNAVKISHYDNTESHSDGRRGQNCMNCHYQGNNSYVYNIAGTVYQGDDTSVPYPNATLYLREGPTENDALLARIEVDGNGNFYSTEALDLSTGVYPFIKGNTGEPTLHMGNFITHGACNSCHGQSTLPLYVGRKTPVPVQRVSQNGLTLSHNDERRGEDCKQCHSEYYVAGTVFNYNLDDYYANGKIFMYTEANGQGELIYSLEIDANGNFYTTDAIDFSTTLYPVLENAAGDYRDYMPAAVSQGACNSCHGVSTLPLYVAEVVNPLVSTHGASNSHVDEKRGQDCLICHYQGNNPYIYTIAGTVYQLDDPTAYFPNATLNFYTQANGAGDLVATVEVDANGNFFTTDPIDFGNGLYPMISSGGIEQPLSMPGAATSGACNSCHDGSAVQRILTPGVPGPLASLHGTSYSHTDGRRGVDCLGCHAIGGTNPFQYSVAGSVYQLDLLNFYPNATISLYTGSHKTGELIATIEVDANGNFYTTQAIDLGKGKNGIYASIVGSQPNSPILEMETRTDNGGCSNSSCHGVTRPPIYAVD